MKTGCELVLRCAPPGSRTQNLRIKSPAQPVRPVLSSPQTRGFVRNSVQGMLPNPPQSGEFVANLVARLQPARKASESVVEVLSGDGGGRREIRRHGGEPVSC